MFLFYIANINNLDFILQGFLGLNNIIVNPEAWLKPKPKPGLVGIIIALNVEILKLK